MATVTGYTKAKMDAIANSVVVDGEVVGDNLILTRYDSSTINAGSVRGPQGIQGPVGPAGDVPVGTFIFGGWDTDPAGYLILNGSTVIGGAITYPGLADCFPGWVVGNDLVLPNAEGCVPLVNNTSYGSVSGSMTHTLTSPNQLPSHNHTGPNHSHTTPNHSHGHNLSINGGGAHGHDVPGSFWRNDVPTYGFASAGSSPPFAAIGTAGTGANAVGTHTHGISGGIYSDGASSTGWSGTGVTGSVGSGAAIDHTPKHIKARMAVKTG